MHTHIQNIKILGTIKKGDKLYVDNGIIYKDERYFLWLRRYLNGICRNDIISYLINSYNKVFLYFQLPQLIPNNDNDAIKTHLDFSKFLKQLIDDSIIGLENLKATYSDDFDALSNIIDWVKAERNKILVSYNICNIEEYKKYSDLFPIFFDNKF